MYVGIDHSTTGVKTAVLEESGDCRWFTIERTPGEDGEWSYLDRLSDYVDLSQIRMVANGYSYGDAFSSIKPIGELEDRGVVDHMGAGHGFGTGTHVFDELDASDLPCVMFPGVHNGLETLHPYFANYSVYSGADTVAMSKFAQEYVKSETGKTENTFVCSCVSSSTMSTLVHRGELRGGFHWLGLIHGHVDVDLLRRIAGGEIDPRNAFMRSGLVYRSGSSFEQVKGVPDQELLDQVAWAAIQNVYALAPFANMLEGGELEQIVLSGRLTCVEEPIDMRDRLRGALEPLAPVHFSQEFSTAIGAAYIARDAYEERDDVLGIPITV